ncbi:hypothetical protein PIROE2DRAFT_3716 [Piromyces sp. E2]|nr:hypothetical protein PIROE2DRAFT_3716 [Piromyces sp. E2]|eukprot:OUM68571.1 hypothetical protein PIROE2DRAFT_3716 [Piromyces sp. E2]
MGIRDNLQYTFLLSYGQNNMIKFKNSILENINIQINAPLFYISSNFEIYNSTIRNCNTNYSYLMLLSSIIRKDTQINIDQLNFIDSSALITGSEVQINIKNSIFHNIINKVPNPIIINMLNSDIRFTDVTFRNITSLRSSFFAEKAQYQFSNVLFEDIATNSKTLIDTFYSDISFFNSQFKNILLNGDVDNSSLINFNSNGNTLNMENVILNNIKANGNLIVIEGYLPNIKINNTEISDTSSFGSLLTNISSNSNIHIINSNILNNVNLNKIKQGLITSYTSVNIIAQNSKFSNNIVKNNGGVFCFLNNTQSDIKIFSSLFENNNSMYGGAIYISNTKNKHSNTTLEIIDSSFVENKVQYLGGGIYIDDQYLKFFNISNSKFIKNSSYAGGALYLNNYDYVSTSNNKDIKEYIYNFKQNNNVFINNTSESHGNDYGSQPYLIYLKDSNDKLQKVEMKSGNFFYISKLLFIIVDVFDQIIVDRSKYYSNIILKIAVIDNNILNNTKSIQSNTIKLIGNECNFYQEAD